VRWHQGKRGQCLSECTRDIAGKQVQVYFQGTTDVSLISDFFVDDVTLNIS
jgi:hypothetical protein